MKQDSWARLQMQLDRLHRDNVLNEGARFAGVASLPAQISNQLEKSGCVQLKGCLSALLLLLFFPCSPKCWQQSFPSTRSTSRLLGKTFPVEVCELSSSAQPCQHKGNDRHKVVNIQGGAKSWLDRKRLVWSTRLELWPWCCSERMRSLSRLYHNNILFIVFALCSWNRDLWRDR